MKKLVTVAAIAALLSACTPSNETVDVPADETPGAVDAGNPGSVDPGLIQQCDSQTPTAACDTEEYRNSQHCEQVRNEAGFTGQPVTDPKCS